MVLFLLTRFRPTNTSFWVLAKRELGNVIEWHLCFGLKEAKMKYAKMGNVVMSTSDMICEKGREAIRAI